jgi:hypothetical protein
MMATVILSNGLSAKPIAESGVIRKLCQRWELNHSLPRSARWSWSLRERRWRLVLRF